MSPDIKHTNDKSVRPSHRLTMRSKSTSHVLLLNQKLEEKSNVNNNPMFPPANIQKPKPDTFKPKLVASKSSDHLSETSEEFKYKVPSSPSASSSSSIKQYNKRPSAKTRSRVMDLGVPVNVTEFPGTSVIGQMVEAPVFRPTDKEFQDPLEYIEKIRVKAEKFGICRIVPPSNFKPECKVSDDMRFTAYDQYVHKMLYRWGPNFKELIAIRKYLETQNITLNHPPWVRVILYYTYLST